MTQIKIDQFSSFSRICSFWTKNGPLTHCVNDGEGVFKMLSWSFFEFDIRFRFGWTANMQRIITSQTHAKQQDMQRDYYLNQKKAIEINPRHPLVKELLRRVEDNPEDAVAKDMALMMFNTATLR